MPQKRGLFNMQMGHLNRQALSYVTVRYHRRNTTRLVDYFIGNSVDASETRVALIAVSAGLRSFSRGQARLVICERYMI